MVRAGCRPVTHGKQPTWRPRHDAVNAPRTSNDHVVPCARRDRDTYTAVPQGPEEADMAVEAGQEAPDFTLKDQNGDDVTLSAFRGRDNVVLVFYPFTFTGVCEGELCRLRDDRSDF